MGIQLGSLLIPYYGLCIAIGVVIAGAVGYLQAKRHNLNPYDFLILVAVCALSGMAGAKILYLIVSWDKIDWSRITDLKYFNALIRSGFVFYGGLIGGIIAILICRKYFHLSLSQYVTYCIPALPIVHAFGRIGCSLVGCCYGAPYNGFGAITYTDSPIAPNHTPLFPVQLSEACANVVIAVILLFYVNKKTSQKRESLALYLTLYAPIRFILEFFRYDYAERGMWGWFSTSQWISIALFIGALTWFMWKQKRRTK